MKNIRFDIRAKILLTVAVLLAIAVVAMATLVSTLTQRAIEDIASRQMVATVQYVGEELDGKIGIFQRALIKLAESVTPDMLAHPEQIQSFLDQQKPMPALFSSGVFVSNRDGRILADYLPVKGRAGGSGAEKEWFKDTIATRKPAIGRPTIGKYSPVPLVVLTAPIFAPNGDLIGVVSGSMSLSDPGMFGQLERMVLGKSGSTLVVSRKYGLYVSATDKTQLLKPIPPLGTNPLFDRRFYEHFEGPGISTNPQGIETLSASRDLKTTDWMVLGEISTEEAFKAVSEQKHKIYAVAILIGFAILAALLWLLRRQIAPLTQATSAMRRMTTGEAPLSPLAISRNDEVGEMANAFNQLLTAREQAGREIRASEERYRMVLERMVEAVVIFDAQGRVVTGNPSAESLFGLSREQMAAAPNIEQLWQGQFENGQMLQNDDWPHRQAINRRHAIYEQGLGILRKDGTLRWVVADAQPLFDDSGIALTGVFCTYIDISDQRRAAKLNLEKEAAEAASETKSRFMASMSHELRTPLNAILGFAQLLENDPPVKGAEGSQRKVAHILKAGRHLLSMIDEILDLSRIEAGALHLSMETTDLNALIQDSIALAQEMASKRHITLSFPTASEKCWVKADRTRMCQVIVNLLSNAVKYNHEGGAVYVSLDVDGEQATIAVRDTGSGLTEQQRQNLFQPFNRLGAEKGKVEGTGIGLVITKQLVEAMQGRLNVESTPGVGSTFLIHLPLHQAPSSIPLVDQAASETAPIGKNHIQPAQTYRILCVEDNPANIDLITSIFESHPQFKLETRRDGIEGLAAIIESQPDLVLLDINLPGMDGYSILRELRQRNEAAHIPCVAMTANAMSGDAAKARAAGFVDYITKPFDVSTLAERIQSIITSHKKVV